MKLLIILFIYFYLPGNINAADSGSISFQEVARVVERFPILPGTRWCGNGNRSSQSGRELGVFTKTDNCCRNHDMCPDNIAAGSNKHGLRNIGSYTRSHCACDQDFYKCLKEAGTPLSYATGTTYFTVLGPQCFQQVYPITGCLNKQFRRCVEYKFNKNAEPIWQWMDNPVF